MLKKDYLDFARDPSVTNQVLEDIYLGQSFLKHGKKYAVSSAKVSYLLECIQMDSMTCSLIR